jgi:septal ring factor EnvC (AmiA/AmiB activator)
MNPNTASPQKNTAYIFSLVINAVLFLSTAVLAFLYMQSNRDLEAQKSSVISLQTELAKEAARTAEVKSDLNATRTTAQSLAEKSALLQSTITSNEATIAQEKARAESAQAALDKEKSRFPAVPVRLETRRSSMGKGLVAILSNTSEKHLQLLVAIANPTTKVTKQFTLQIAPGRKSELGHQEGWAFASGDIVMLRSSGFEDVKHTVH